MIIKNVVKSAFYSPFLHNAAAESFTLSLNFVAQKYYIVE